MRTAVFLAIATLALSACATAADSPSELSASASHIAAAVSDSNRPSVDRERDALRKPAEMLAFAQVSPGQRVADLLPGGGYFTRLFSAAVGPEGRVVAIVPPQQAAGSDQSSAAYAIAADPHYANVEVVVSGFTDFAVNEPLDVVWTAQNYHDLHLTRLNLDVSAVNAAIFNALRPGGLYVIVDHSALAGAEVGATADTLHRIDQAVVRREVEAAGFVYEGEDNALRSADDARTINVFDPAIRGRTDQFVLRFRKPG